MGETKVPQAGAPAKDVEDWVASNAQLVMGILAFVDIPMALSLRRFGSAHEMWNYLHTTYSQNTASRQFDLEGEISCLA
ncbi:unnamed protein product [Linum trigynum]|uniref:Uncharacterized protein n=1 Tax=Linum trigynum TaxID=586398 RepID=A0AAV2DWE2_9ROSI